MNFVRRYVKKLQKGKDSVEARKDVGVFSGIVGIVSNILLFLVKAIAGIVSGSISVLADAVNNLSDGISSLFTVIGFYWAAKPADKEHPYGHQRMEYISGLAVSFIILYIGIEFLLSSIDRIINPEAVVSSPLVLVLLVFSVVVKIIQGKFYSTVADEIDSQTIQTVSKDSYNDVIMSVGIILSYVVESFTGWYIDGYIGVVVAVIILISGAQSISESISRLIGEPPSKELIDQMKEILNSYPQLVGYHDLYIHRYGPNNTFATVDIELDARMHLSTAHDIINAIEREFLEELDVHLVSHIDPVELDNDFQNILHSKIKDILRNIDSNLKFHDFQIVEIDGRPTIQFDIVVPESLDYTDEALEGEISDNLGDLNQYYPLKITFDHNYLLNE